jgi:hypothetical protein
VSVPPRRIAAVLFAAALATLARGWSLTWDPDALPSWDPAMYMVEAMELRQAVLSGDLWLAARLAARPDVHPPLHSALLALWMMPFGTGLFAARAFAAFATVVTLVLTVALGRAVAREPEEGLVVGAGAALLTAVGFEQLAMASCPMTEATATPVALAVILLALAGGDAARDRLLLGGAVLVSGLVRYNLPPMLVLPILAAEAWNRRGFDRRLLLVPLPTLVFFAAWQLCYPELGRFVWTFVENRTSGVPFWSVENLAWAPLQLTRLYLQSWLITLPLLALFGLSLLRGGPPRVVHAWVLFGFAAVTIHPYKLTRNLAGLLPAFYAAALAALPPVAGPMALRVLAALVLVAAGWQHGKALGRVAERSDFRRDEAVSAVLAFVERQATLPETWVLGTVFRIPPGLVEWWLRTRVPGTVPNLETRLFGETVRGVASDAWSEDYRTHVDSVLLAPERRDRTTWITLAIEAGSRFWDQPKAFGNHYARAFSESGQATEIDRLELTAEGLTARAWRVGGVPRADAPQAAGPPPWKLFGERPELATPSADGRGWTLTEASPKLQACGAELPWTGAGIAEVDLTWADVTGKAWMHLRPLDAQDRLVPAADGTSAILFAGPFTGSGDEPRRVRLRYPEGTAKVRPCLMLDGVTGTLQVRELRIVPP